jgi:hypothetical protein
VQDGDDLDWAYACFQGPDRRPSCNGSPAAVADNDDDGDVDVRDLASFQFDWDGMVEPPPPPVNIIQNPDFEDPQGGGAFPAAWFHSADGAIWTQEDWISPSHAVKQVDTSNVSNTGWRSFAQPLPVGTTAIEVAWYWRYENLNLPWQRVVAFGTGADGIGNLTGFFAQDIQEPAQATSSGWEHHTVTMPVPAHPGGPGQPVYLDLRFRSWGDVTAFGATGTMWVDDVRVTPLE